MSDLGRLNFFPWVRRGLSIGIDRTDADVAGTTATILRLSLTFNEKLAVAATRLAESRLPLIGPGEITGFDSRAVIRTFPVANESDAEYQHFAFVEFRDVDLPWRYTPAAALQDRLRPWLMLVLFTDEEGAIQPAGQANLLSVANIDLAALPPNPMQAWAWPHVQLNGGTAEEALADSAAPGLGLSRLYCPRFLEPRKKYNAVLVPYFERGRLAGLGTTFPDDSTPDPQTNPDALQAAWQANEASGRRDFPIYYQWTFSTGDTGSFEELARRLAPNPLPVNLGLRGMDVSEPGLQLPPVANAEHLANKGVDGGMGVEGALRGLNTEPTEWPPADKNAWLAALKPVVEKGQIVVAGTGIRRLLVPAMYGQWHAARSTLQAGDARPWFFELNVDPRYRVAAALGTQVIQRNQEALMASAWRQLGHLREVNTHLKVLQLAREASKRLWSRNFLTRSRNRLLEVTSPVHSRIRALGDAKTIFGFVKNSPLSNGILDPNWRRFTRALGPIGRKQGRPFFPTDTVPDLIDRVNDGTVKPGEPSPAPATMATMPAVTDGLRPGSVDAATQQELLSLTEQRLVFWGLLLIYASRELLIRRQGNYWWLLARGLRLGAYFIRLAANPNAFGIRESTTGLPGPQDISAQPGMGNFEAAAEHGSVPSGTPAPPSGTDNPIAAEMRSALVDLCTLLDKPLTPVKTLVKLKLAETEAKITAGLAPELTIPRAVKKRLAVNGVKQDADDPLEPIMAAPEFPQPMLEPLQELSNEWVLPGIGKMQPETLGLIEPNQKFIEAFMVGLNHEMARELLFREYPTDQRGTYFRRFWDNRGYVDNPNDPLSEDASFDIKNVHEWRTSALGANSPRRNVFGQERRHIVFLVRGELIRRYPNVIVSAIKSNADKNGFAQDPLGKITQKHPVFFSRLPPDVAVYGFELREDEDLKTAPGWFFVLQEQPAEPKFGFTASLDGSIRFFDAELDVSPPVPAGAIPTSADIATAIFRDPFRVAVHSLSLFAAGS